MDTNKMTQHEKDLQRAKEYVPTNETAFHEFNHDQWDIIAEVCSVYVNHLEAAGVIKYTARREEE